MDGSPLLASDPKNLPPKIPSRSEKVPKECWRDESDLEISTIAGKKLGRFGYINCDVMGDSDTSTVICETV